MSPAARMRFCAVHLKQANWACKMQFIAGAIHPWWWKHTSLLVCRQDIGICISWLPFSILRPGLILRNLRYDAGTVRIHLFMNKECSNGSPCSPSHFTYIALSDLCIMQLWQDKITWHFWTIKTASFLVWEIWPQIVPRSLRSESNQAGETLSRQSWMPFLKPSRGCTGRTNEGFNAGQNSPLCLVNSY